MGGYQPLSAPGLGKHRNIFSVAFEIQCQLRLLVQPVNLPTATDFQLRGADPDIHELYATAAIGAGENAICAGGSIDGELCTQTACKALDTSSSSGELELSFQTFLQQVELTCAVERQICSFKRSGKITQPVTFVATVQSTRHLSATV